MIVEITTEKGKIYKGEADLLGGSGSYSLVMGTSVLFDISYEHDTIKKWIIYNDTTK